jgi:hypothetical protein
MFVLIACAVFSVQERMHHFDIDMLLAYAGVAFFECCMMLATFMEEHVMIQLTSIVEQLNSNYHARTMETMSASVFSGATD